MTSEIPGYFQELFEKFSVLGLDVSFEANFKKSDFGESLTVSLNPGEYKEWNRFVHICKNADGSWNPVSDGIYLEESYTTDDIIVYVQNRMTCTFEECELDYKRRVSIIESKKK